MRKFVNIICSMPNVLKILIGIFTFPFGIVFLFFCYAMAPLIKRGYEVEDRFNAVINNPNEENLVELMRYMENYSVANHPDTWQRLRGLWNVVNRSNAITTPTKEKFLAVLISKGLYMNNTRVNNNFDSNASNMQEEMNRQFNEFAMEEARKSVTPFDHGGYVQGDGFNPSDTMAADAQRQAESMNQMNDMNNMGMF